MAYTRTNLVDEALANLGIVQQADSSAARTRAELVNEVMGNLGLNQAAYVGGQTRTRAELVSEALGNLGINQAAYAGSTRTRAELVTEALGNLGLNQAAYAGGTRTRVELVTEALGNLGLNQAAYAGATKTRAQLVAAAMAALGVVQQTPTVSAGTKTRAELIDLVLYNFGILSEGRAARPAEVAAVTAALDPVVRDLDARGVVTIADTNAIDNKYFFQLGAIVTEAMKEQFGAQGEAAAIEITDAKQAELSLKIITRSALVDAKLDAIAADLKARAVANLTIPIVTVPEQYFPTLATIVANEAKGFFDWIGADVATRAASDALAAERKLRSITGTALVDEKIDAIAAELKARAIVALTVPVVTVPEQYFPAVASIVASSVKSKFEWIAAEAGLRIAAEAADAELKLRTLTGTGLVDEKLDSLMAELQARTIATIVTPVVTVPTQWFPALAAILADSCKGKFTVPTETMARAASESAAAELKLRSLTGTALVDEKLDSVAAELAARAIAAVAVPVVTVPTQWFPALAAILANATKGRFIWLSPETVGRAAAEAAEAELKLRTLTGTALVDEKLPSLFGELNARSIATVANIQAIPGAWFSALADIAAENCRGKFIVAPEIALRVTARAQVAERTLKNLTRTYIVDRNIDAILSELAAREIVYLIDLTDIPQEWFSHVAWIVADRCKSKFELDVATLQLAALEGANAIATLRELTRGRPSYNTLCTCYM